jgi:hypothetical protein
MPMDESLFLVRAPDTAGEAVDNFCLGVIQVHEVGTWDSTTTQGQGMQPKLVCGS